MTVKITHKAVDGKRGKQLHSGKTSIQSEKNARTRGNKPVKQFITAWIGWQADKTASVTSLCIAGCWTALLLRKKTPMLQGCPVPEQAACTDLDDAFKNSRQVEADKQTSRAADEATPTTPFGPMERNEKLNEEGLPTSVGVALIGERKRTKLSINGYQRDNSITRNNVCTT